MTNHFDTVYFLTATLCFLIVTDCPLTQNLTKEAGKEVAPAETESVLQLSRAEGKQAWLTAGGDTERAARQALRDRLAKVTHDGNVLTCALVFHESLVCVEIQFYFFI